MSRAAACKSWARCEPDWSPDGKRRACSMSRLLYLLDVDGKDTRIIPAQRGPGNDAAWSPDGKWLAFAGNSRGIIDDAG
jgi:Tol biopolymer transport system component